MARRKSNQEKFHQRPVRQPKLIEEPEPEEQASTPNEWSVEKLKMEIDSMTRKGKNLQLLKFVQSRRVAVILPINSLSLFRQSVV